MLLASVAKLTLSSILNIEGASLLLLEETLLLLVTMVDCLAKLPNVKPPPPPKMEGLPASPKATLPKKGELLVVVVGGVLLTTLLGVAVALVAVFVLELPKMLPPEKIFVLPVEPKTPPPPLLPKPPTDDPKNFPAPSAVLPEGGVVRDAGCSSGLLVLVCFVPAATLFVDVLPLSTVVDVTWAPDAGAGATNEVFGVVLSDAEKIDPPEAADPTAVELPKANLAFVPLVAVWSDVKDG